MVLKSAFFLTAIALLSSCVENQKATLISRLDGSFIETWNYEVVDILEDETTEVHRAVEVRIGPKNVSLSLQCSLKPAGEEPSFAHISNAQGETPITVTGHNTFVIDNDVESVITEVSGAVLRAEDCELNWLAGTYHLTRAEETLTIAYQKKGERSWAPFADASLAPPWPPDSSEPPALGEEIPMLGRNKSDKPSEANPVEQD